MLRSIFETCSMLISAYSFICLLRIFLTWMPQFAYSQAGRFLAEICDPYLNWFRRFSFTRVGMMDFSPIIALGVLYVASSAFTTLALNGRVTAGFILAGILAVIWSFFSFILNILLFALIIRLIYDLFNRYGYSSFWSMLDRFLNPVISRVTAFFRHGKPFKYRTSLILSLVCVLAVRVALGYGIAIAANFLKGLPF